MSGVPWPPAHPHKDSLYPQISLAVRAGAFDPVYAQAQRISTGQVSDETAAVVYESKQVSARLELPPAEMRSASEVLQQIGGVPMLDRQLPWKREQQLSLPLDTEHADALLSKNASCLYPWRSRTR